jgi:hypothetical protein
MARVMLGFVFAFLLRTTVAYTKILPLFPEGHNISKYITDGTDTRTFNSCRKKASQACNSTRPDYCSDPEKNFPSSAKPDCFPPSQCGQCFPGGSYADGVAYFCSKDATSVLLVVYHAFTNCTKVQSPDRDPIREAITPDCGGDPNESCHAHCKDRYLPTPACRGASPASCRQNTNPKDCNSAQLTCCQWMTTPDLSIDKQYDYMYIANASGNLVI